MPAQPSASCTAQEGTPYPMARQGWVMQRTWQHMECILCLCCFASTTANSHRRPPDLWHHASWAHWHSQWYM